jgi:hypothetical protein
LEIVSAKKWGLDLGTFLRPVGASYIVGRGADPGPALRRTCSGAFETEIIDGDANLNGLRRSDDAGQLEAAVGTAVEKATARPEADRQ